MIIAGLFWNYTNWVKFRFNTGQYDNFLNFLNSNDLSFISELPLDFTNIPTTLHGKGRSRNLLDYFANNSEDSTLIVNFLNYFILSIVKIRYFDSNSSINFRINRSSRWQSSDFTANPPYFPPPTTTTTTTLLPTTTLAPTTTTSPTTTITPFSMNMFELFDQLYEI